MKSFERITARIFASLSIARSNPLFAVLVRVRDGRAGPVWTSVCMRGAAVLLAAILPMFAAVEAGAADVVCGPAGSANIADARRQAQIATLYAMSPLLRNSVILVTVTGSNVSLVGKVGSTVEKALAEEIALAVDGIAHVDDLIGVTEMLPMRPAQGDLSFGQKIDDATTTGAIRSKLLWGSATSGLDIQVITVGGKVRLDGTVYDSGQKDLIGHLAADTAGALAVTNEIVVFAVPPVTSGAQADARKLADDVGRPVSDAWITARVKSTFLLSPSMNRSAITVATTDGSVSLSGSAGSASARTSAVALASNTRGVRSVNSANLLAN